MSDTNDTETSSGVPEETPEYELTAEAATGFENAAPSAAPAAFFNRKKVMIVLTIGFSVVVGGGLLFNVSRGNKKAAEETAAAARAGRTPEFLQNQRDRALTGRGREEETIPPSPEVPDEVPASSGADALATPVPVRLDDRTPPPPPPAGGSGGGTGGTAPRADPLLAAYTSPLVPVVEGSLFTRNAQTPAGYGYPPSGNTDYLRMALEAAQAGTAPPAGYGTASSADPYRAQNAQDEKQSFYGAPAGTAGNVSGSFIGPSSLWIGTIIPGILVTGINTDLPGGIIARVTQHVYDSQTGTTLLVPQGSILVARYNSSISYAQHRVQIAWDTLIRPDGFLLDLGGMNGVDQKGMAGQLAEYRENWFEYLKAAGIITMFSIANARMTEEAAKYADEAAAASIAQSNAAFVNQMGGNIVARAMNIQPTLTVESGTLINIMLNKNLFLPPVPVPPVPGKYILE